MTDIQIAQQAVPLPIGDIAASCGIDPQYVEQTAAARPRSSTACCGSRPTGPTANSS